MHYSLLVIWKLRNQFHCTTLTNDMLYSMQFSFFHLIFFLPLTIILIRWVVVMCCDRPPATTSPPPPILQCTATATARQPMLPSTIIGPCNYISTTTTATATTTYYYQHCDYSCYCQYSDFSCTFAPSPGPSSAPQPSSTYTLSRCRGSLRCTMLCF